MRVKLAALMVACGLYGGGVHAQVNNINQLNWSGTNNNATQSTQSLASTTTSDTTAIANYIAQQYNIPYGIPQLNGHAAISNSIEGPVDNATVSNQPLGYLITKIMTQNSENKWIAQGSYDVANGTPQLDGSAHLYNPGLSIYHVYTRSDGTQINTPALYMGDSTIASQYYTLPDNPQVIGGFVGSTTIGGQTVTYPSYAAMSLIGRPYGPYNAGAVLYVAGTSDTLSGTGGQAPISNYDYRQGAAAISKMSAEQATYAQYDQNYAARVVSAVTSFDASTATLTTPLTEEQLALIHPGMYVATNVISPNAPATTASGLIAENTYWGIVQSATANTITVYGWAVLNEGDAGVGQIPNAKYLDTTKSAYGTPMIFIGAPAVVRSNKVYVDFDGSRTYGPNAVARSNTYNRELTTFAGKNFAKEDSLLYQGFETDFICDACDANAINRSSFGYYVNGPGLPVAYKAHVYGTGVEFLGDSVYLPGPGAPADAIGSNHIMSDYMSSLPMGQQLHMNTRVYHDVSGNTDPAAYAVRIGTTLGGTRTQDVYAGGTDSGFISFGPQGNAGYICLETSNQSPSLCQTASGDINISNTLSVNSLQSESYRINTASLTNAGIVTGSGAIFDYNDQSNAEVDQYAVRQNSSNASGFVRGILTTGSKLSNGLILENLNASGDTISVPVNQTAVPTLSTAGNVSTYASGGFTSEMIGRTGGSAVGDFYAKLSVQEQVGAWTGVMLQLNGYTGVKTWRFGDDGSMVFPDGTVFTGKISDTALARFVTLDSKQTIIATKVICTSSTCVDLQPGALRDLKIEGNGMSVTGGFYGDTVWVQDNFSMNGIQLTALDQTHGLFQWKDQYHAMAGDGSFIASGSTISLGASDDNFSFLTNSDGVSDSQHAFQFQFYNNKAVETPFSIQRSQIVINAPLVVGPKGSISLSNVNVDTLNPAKNNYIVATAPIIPQTYTYATLPTTYPQWGEVVCTDCRSYLTSSLYKTSGIRVQFNGTDWTDMLGNKLPSVP